jgi:hypothetical protein
LTVLEERLPIACVARSPQPAARSPQPAARSSPLAYSSSANVDAVADALGEKVPKGLSATHHLGMTSRGQCSMSNLIAAGALAHEPTHRTSCKYPAPALLTHQFGVLAFILGHAAHTP